VATGPPRLGHSLDCVKRALPLIKLVVAATVIVVVVLLHKNIKCSHYSSASNHRATTCKVLELFMMRYLVGLPRVSSWQHGEARGFRGMDEAHGMNEPHGNSSSSWGSHDQLTHGLEVVHIDFRLYRPDPIFSGLYDIVDFPPRGGGRFQQKREIPAPPVRW